MVSMPYKVVLALGKARLLLSRKLYGTYFSLNTCVMKAGFQLCTVLQISVKSSCRNIWLTDTGLLLPRNSWKLEVLSLCMMLSALL